MFDNVGIPQALLYHEFGGLWTTFFQNLGVQVMVSGETSKRMLDYGTSLAIDESCLPLKVYLGHVASLLDKCSHIFVPRIVRYHRHFYFCAKFAGLPDIVRNTFNLPAERLISPTIETKSLAAQVQAVYAACRALDLSLLAGELAYNRSLKSWRAQLPSQEQSPRPRIAVIGHNYLLKDALFGKDIIGTLTAQGAVIVTPDNIGGKVLYDEAKAFAPDIYWQLSAKIAGAARYFCRQSDIAGIVMVSSFGCGPDSLVNEYLEHHVFRKSDKPYIIINIDEHTGSAGIITRLEAFWDLANRRAKP
ncbi:conserved hypothetical protein [Thermosinus carboxydivorans Nor1]|uniref:DUF2229 domain-containing protein n=1 Tax=Thermosinus carboxydivorans Nor1 TaxID=401526 RepID=A1HRA3_9FIRM|nr:acyl-CoA dehydratase activase-related protein [Thermosinus carboxydivorans]EAX47418.1 conserved hypothetical protein [Thermosinus carboxydivorans Nor1]